MTSKISASPRLRVPIALLLLSAPLYAQVPSQDSRLTTIPHTDYHFTPKTYATREAWETHRAHLRKQILSAAGLFPMPAKTPLHPQIFGKITTPNYTIEKVLLETFSGFYLGGNLYRPTKPAPPEGFPAVVSPHGHWNYGRLEHNDTVSIPARCISLAQQGYVVFSYDMVGYDDTVQTPHEFETPEYLLWDFGPYALQLWNSIRAVDFVESLPGINPKMIGATGASGGGTQTFSLAAVDDRIQFAAPVNMISLIMQGGAICENAAGLRFDTNNVEIAAMFAPKPMIMVASTGDWTKNMQTEEYPAVKAIYELYDKAANLEMFYQDAPHNYNRAAREAVYNFFGKHVLNLPNPQFHERGVRIEKLQDMLVLSNRKLPDNALDFPGVFAQWKKMMRESASAANRETLEYTLGVEWPKVIAERTSEDMILSRVDRGDRVVAHHAATGDVVINGWSIDLFQRPTKPTTKMFLTFNRSDDANRVQDILTALAWLNQPNVDLTCSARYAPHCAYAAAVSHQPVTLHADLSAFHGTDRDYLDHFFIPGIQRVGQAIVLRGLPGAPKQ
jgi:dienelactone hydrolase